MAAEMRTQPSTPYGTIRSGVVLSNESFAEWAERTDMKYMLQLATPLFYTYGYSDVGLVPAGEDQALPAAGGLGGASGMRGPACC